MERNRKLEWWKVLFVAGLVLLSSAPSMAASKYDLVNASYYTEVSNSYGSAGSYYGMLALWCAANGYDPSSYAYYAYTNMAKAYSYAYTSWSLVRGVYPNLINSNLLYYTYLYGYYDYLYKYYAYVYAYYTYVGYDYALDAITYTYYGDAYNGYAAYYISLDIYNYL
jgi:hypothetical protein